MEEVLYKDSFGEVWIGSNPRGCYIDMIRKKDQYVLPNCRSIGYHVPHVKYQSDYWKKSNNKLKFRKWDPKIALW